jgi:hypothetical protein
VTFSDVGAVVYFLRKVMWTVPGFTAGAYRERLARLHEHIQAEGSFVCHAQRFLVGARKSRRPGGGSCLPGGVTGEFRRAGRSHQHVRRTGE